MTSLWKTIWSRLLPDILFRIGLYRGIKVASPTGLIICVALRYRNTGMFRTYETALNEDHALAPFLLYDCGPWSFGMERPLYYRRCYLTFARVSDAVTFRLLQ